MAVELKALLRDATKKSVRKQLRKQGKIPAIVYGKTVGNLTIAVDKGDLIRVFNNAGKNEVIQLDIEGKNKTSVMAHAFQVDPINRQMIHIDFKEINMNETVDVSVPIHILGEEAIEKRDGVVQQNVNELQIRALPGDIPSFIELDVTELQIGDSLRVSDLKSGLGNTYEVLNHDDEVLVTINHPQLIDENPVVDEEGGEAPEGEGESTEPAEKE
jgi:large subunit ribosomal protein L25